MPPLYRLTTKERWEAFERDGSLYLNTLYALAQEEKNGRGVYDSNEGTRALAYLGRLTDVPIGFIISAVNSYVLCAAERVTNRMIETWRESDFMFRIDDDRFFIEIEKVLKDRCVVFDVAPVEYADWANGESFTEWVDRRFPHATSIEQVQLPLIAWMKDQDMDYQHEWRAVYEPPSPGEIFTNGDDDPDGVQAFSDAFYSGREGFRATHGSLCDLQPIIIKVPDARKYVTPLGQPFPIP